MDKKKDKCDEDLEDGLTEGEGSDQVCGGAVWDIHCNFEQMEAISYAVRSSCELGFEKVSIYSKSKYVQ